MSPADRRQTSAADAPSARPAGGIVYLVLCHEHPAQLARLIEAIRDPRDRVVVHVDRRAQRDAFSAAVADPAVVFVEPAHAVHWAAYSMVEATLAALRTALARWPDCARLCLLSGSSYPALPTATLRDRLLADPVTMRARRLAAGDDDTERFRRYFLLDHPLLNARPVGPRSPHWGELRALVDRFLRSLPPLELPQLPLWKGSQWWCIDAGSAQAVLDFVDDPGHAALLDRFRYSHAPDETLIQSLVGARQADPRSLRSPTHYMDWSPVDGELPPRVLHSDADYDAIVASGLPFARKLCPRRSAALLDRLDRWRGSSLPTARD